MHWPGRGNRGIGIAHLGPGDRAAFEHQLGFYAKESRLPQHQIRQLAHFHRAHLMVEAMGDGGVDRHLGDVALQAGVVVAAVVAFEHTPLHLHLVGGLEGAGDHLTHAAHGLGVAGNDAESAQVVKDVFGGDGFAANPRFSKGHVLGNRGIQVVAHHQHVEVLLERVARVGPGGIGAAGQHIGFTANADDVGGMAAASAFGVEGVNRAAFDGGDGVFHKPRLIEGVGVDADLHIEAIGNAQTAIDRRWCGAPVLMQFEAAGAGTHLLIKGLRGAGIALAEKAQIHRQAIGGLQHAADVKCPWRAGGGVGACGWAGAAPQQRGDPAGDRRFDLLRADEVDVGVDAASREDVPLTGNGFSARSDGDGHPIADVGIARFADGADAAVFEAHISFDNAPPIQDQGVGDHRVNGTRSAAGLALAHAITDDLAAAELHLIAIDGVVLLDFEDQLGIGEPNPVACGGAVGLGIGPTINPIRH